MITLFWLAAFALAWIKWTPKAKKKPPVPVTVGDVKRAEKERKEALKKATAEREVETLTERIKLLDALLDSTKRKYESATKDKDVERLTRQIISLEGQIATAENKIEKAKYIVKYGG